MLTGFVPPPGKRRGPYNPPADQGLPGSPLRFDLILPPLLDQLLDPILVPQQFRHFLYYQSRDRFQLLPEPVEPPPEGDACGEQEAPLGVAHDFTPRGNRYHPQMPPEIASR